MGGGGVQLQRRDATDESNLRPTKLGLVKPKSSALACSVLRSGDGNVYDGTGQGIVERN